jgi:hypothetical protein
MPTTSVRRRISLDADLQLHDMKGSVETATIQPIGLAGLRRPVRGDPGPAEAGGGDAIAIDAYLGTDDTFAQALEEFAQVYADQAEQDYGQLQQASSTKTRPHTPAPAPSRSAAARFMSD